MYTLPEDTHGQYDSIDEFIEAYFRQMAEKLLAHTETRKSFFVNSDVEEATELQEALSSQLKLPALILDNFDDTLSDANSNTHSIYESAITVIDIFQPGDARDLRRARRGCRNLIRKMVFKMIRDSYKGRPGGGVLIDNLIYLDRDQINGMPLGIFEGQFTGWTYEFRWKVQENINYGLEEF